MQISATVVNAPGQHSASVSTEGKSQSLPVPAKPEGGSTVNGGEFLMLALATCYCNDLYREAARLKIELQQVDVEATATFSGIGLAASNVRYRAKVQSSAAPEAVARLLQQTDAVAEIHNTLRSGVSVQFVSW